MITLSTRKWATIKKTAQIVQPNVTKKAKLIAQIEELNKQLVEAEAAIAEWDGAIIRMTGYPSSSLITRVIEPTGKVDANGKALMVTKWVPTDKVKFNEEENVYEIVTSPCDSDDFDGVIPTEEVEETEIETTDNE